MTQVTVRRGPPPRLSVATDGYAMVFRRLRSPSLSDAHTDTLTHVCTCTHILCPWWDTISTLQHSLFLCLPPAQTHTNSRQPPSPPPQVCVYVCVFMCVQPSSLIMSVCSVLVCVNCLLLAGPSVLWLQSWWWLLSHLSSLLPPLLWCLPSLTEAKQVHHFSSFGKLTFTNELTLANPRTSVKDKCSVSKFAEQEETEPYYKDFIVVWTPTLLTSNLTKPWLVCWAGGCSATHTKQKLRCPF